MEERINVAEILRNCQSGMELDCVMFDNVTFISIEVGTKPICIKTGDVYRYLTEFGTWTYDENAKCVIFPKGKTTWEGFVPPREFKNGDIIFTRTFDATWVSIFKQFSEDRCCTYIDLCIDDNKIFNTWGVCHIEEITEQRLATKEQRDLLFQKMKESGYKWNEETKTPEKLIVPKFKVGDVIQDKDSYKVKITDVCVEDKMYGYESVIVKGIGGIGFERQDEWELVPDKFDINTLVPFESRVLVRGTEEDIWGPAIWGCYVGITNSYCVLGGIRWEQCIPYEGNEHLIGKRDECDEFFKTWK